MLSSPIRANRIHSISPEYTTKRRSCVRCLAFFVIRIHSVNDLPDSPDFTVRVKKATPPEQVESFHH